jgi:hypothetical protein
MQTQDKPETSPIVTLVAISFSVAGAFPTKGWNSRIGLSICHLGAVMKDQVEKTDIVMVI